jgi:hypothetical protein
VKIPGQFLPEINIPPQSPLRPNAAKGAKIRRKTRQNRYPDARSGLIKNRLVKADAISGRLQPGECRLKSMRLL